MSTNEFQIVLPAVRFAVNGPSAWRDLFRAFDIAVSAIASCQSKLELRCFGSMCCLSLLLVVDHLNRCLDSPRTFCHDSYLLLLCPIPHIPCERLARQHETVDLAPIHNRRFALSRPQPSGKGNVQFTPMALPLPNDTKVQWNCCSQTCQGSHVE